MHTNPEPTMTTPAKTIEQANANIDCLLRRLALARAQHAERAAANPTHWGFAGDVQHLEQRLKELVEGMGG